MWAQYFRSNWTIFSRDEGRTELVVSAVAVEVAAAAARH